MVKGALVAAAAVAATVAAFAGVTRGASTATSCTLGNGVKHVIYLQFDNTHYNRDKPDVASDLEQMPHLLDFLKSNGTLFTNDHTILISHTAGGILSSLTGLYPDRTGQIVTNSYGYYPANGVPLNTSAFKYWTAPVDPVNDTLPNMITTGQKNTPAPWVPFTRAGCDVGGVGTANIELENASTSATGDITKVFGQGSPEWIEAAANAQQGQTDFVGIAIHCGNASTSVCKDNAHAKPDLLPDEPGGYTGFNALYGTKYVDPAITSGKACVDDTAGGPITDPIGICGFPGFDGMLAKNTLGYVEQMQEAGVPVTYGYISDAHDLHVPTLATDSYSSSATGPGEITHEQQLKAYDAAFASFFTNLQQHGITKENTLFVITVDEGDHFAGGVGNPQTDAGNLVYDHRTCTTPAFPNCPTNQIGEITTNISGLLPATEPAFAIHFDDAPAFYVNGQPPRTDPTVRQLERDTGALTAPDPYVRSSGVPQTVPLAQGLIDTVGEAAIHMVNADPSRTPTFTMFGDPDFFFQTTNPCTGTAICVSPGFAWNHGDFQEEIGNTWVGFVGPNVAAKGVDSSTWTDHTNLRPTILSLVGLKDDYVDDGHLIVQALSKVPASLSGASIAPLEKAYEDVDASFGAFSQAVIKASTKALVSNDAGDATYNSIEGAIVTLTGQRNALADQIKKAIFDATFGNGKISDAQAKAWTNQANSLVSQAQALS
jgi:hypothetical protein